MKVLVTGASGYLGGRLCAALLRDGHCVRAFVRRTSDLGALPISSSSSSSTTAAAAAAAATTTTSSSSSSSPSLELTYGDVTDLPSLLSACDGCDALFHAAALVEPWLPDPSRFFSMLPVRVAFGVPVNVGGLENVLRAVKETKTIQKIIYTSSFFALGPTNGYVADEQQMHQGKVFCTEYEKSKVLADRIALQAAADGVPIVLVYPGVIYGPGKLTTGNIVAHIIIERFNWRLPGYVGDGNNMSFCHVDDVVNGHIAAWHKGRVGERYLLTGENASFIQVFDMAATITKTNRPLFRIPLSLINIYGWISVFFSRITGKLPLISYPTVRVLGHQWAYSCAKAREELGYSPRGLNEGLVEILSWLKSSGLITY